MKHSVCTHTSTTQYRLYPIPHLVPNRVYSAASNKNHFTISLNHHQKIKKGKKLPTGATKLFR